MADANLTKRIAELEAENRTAQRRGATSRPLRRRLGGKLTDTKLRTFNKPGRVIGDGNTCCTNAPGTGRAAGFSVTRFPAGRATSGSAATPPSRSPTPASRATNTTGCATRGRTRAPSGNGRKTPPNSCAPRR